MSDYAPLKVVQNIKYYVPYISPELEELMCERDFKTKGNKGKTSRSLQSIQSEEESTITRVKIGQNTTSLSKIQSKF